MEARERYADYDPFAWVYNRHWGPDSARVALAALDELLLDQLPPPAHLMDLCCGTGQLAQALVGRRYQVTGLDGSDQMLAVARENAPQARFILGDARHIGLAPTFDAVISVADSLNHIMHLDELQSAFAGVHDALVPEGIFVFDLNMEEGYRSRWRGSVCDCRGRPRMRGAVLLRRR